jgi:hypothetical protein
MDVCIRLFCVCVVLCVGSGLSKGWSIVQGVVPSVYRLRNWKSSQGPQGLYSHRDREREREKWKWLWQMLSGFWGCVNWFRRRGTWYQSHLLQPSFCPTDWPTFKMYIQCVLKSKDTNILK